MRRLRLCVLVLLLLCAVAVWAAVALDTHANILTVQAGASYSYTHTVAAGSNLAIFLMDIASGNNFGDPVVQLDKRAEATPNTAGTNALTATLQCTTTTGASTTFTSAGVAARIPLNLQILAIATAPGVVRIHIEGTID